MADRDTQTELISIGEAGRLLGVSADTLRRWDAAGKLTAVRTIGGQRRFRRDEIEALASGAVGAA